MATFPQNLLRNEPRVYLVIYLYTLYLLYISYFTLIGAGNGLLQNEVRMDFDIYIHTSYLSRAPRAAPV